MHSSAADAAAPMSHVCLVCARQRYEQIGILPPPVRKNGQRRYEKSMLFRLAVVQRAQESGFTLGEIRELFSDFVRRRAHQNAGMNFQNARLRNCNSE
jgi:DNA-binding transcriptional MerR regulator